MATGERYARTLFYSRRIGLNRNRVMPIDAGGRLTGKVGDYGVGVMNIQTGDEDRLERTPATNFTVVRVKRDILRRSTIGAMFTNRTGVDGRRRVEPGLRRRRGVRLLPERRDRRLLRAHRDRPASRATTTATRAGSTTAPIATARAEFLKVGDNFNPEVGFLRRDDFAQIVRAPALQPRARREHGARCASSPTRRASSTSRTAPAQVETRQQTGRFNIEFDNSDQFTVEANDNYELLVLPFTPSPGVVVPPGGYTSTT